MLWQPGMDLTLADHWQRYPGISKVTADPATLLLYAPFAQWSHRTQQILWWVLQWFALAASIYIIFRSFVEKELRLLFLLVAVSCFVGSYFWRLHLERGQYYIFETFLISLAIAALRTKRQPIWTGIPFGIAVALRPINIVLVPLLWLMGERAAAKKALLIAAVIFTSSIFVVGWSAWKSWLATVRLYELAEVDPTYEQIHFGPIRATAPAVIEGLNFTGGIYYEGVRSDILAHINNRIVPINSNWAILLNRLTAVGIVGLASAMMWWMARKRPYIPRDAFLMLLVITPVVLDFTRTTRFSYADVAFLPVVALILSVVPRQKLFMVAILFLALYMPFVYIPIHIELLRSLYSVSLVLVLLLNLIMARMHPIPRMQ
jgi:hypothetical protein